MSSAICNLPPVIGQCLASKPRVYYNPRTQRCESFTYGGCGGNENNFQTLTECLQRCGGGAGGGLGRTTDTSEYIPHPLFLGP